MNIKGHSLSSTYPQKCRIKRDKERLKNCSRLKETQETWLLNATCDPELDTGLGEKRRGETIKDTIGIINEI